MRSLVLFCACLIGCAKAVPEFECACANEFDFGGGDVLVEAYSEPFYCFEEVEAEEWASDELVSCAAYGEANALVYTCACACDPVPAC